MMWLKLLLVLVVVSLSGCKLTGYSYEHLKYKRECSPEMKPKVNEAALMCIKNANPSSDEEPEDWVEMCYDKAGEALCPLVEYKIISTCVVDDGFGCLSWSSKQIRMDVN